MMSALHCWNHQRKWLILLFLFHCRVTSQITADPDVIGCAAEFVPTMRIKAGDRLDISDVDIGGFIECRNESRFNQGLLPNHNWRGFITGMYKYPLMNQMQASVLIIMGVEHESSHATMGIIEETENPFELIYDKTYRKSVLNSLQSGVSLETFDANDHILCQSKVGFYLKSKNTPELSGLSTGSAIGISFGGVYRHQFKNRCGWFISLHERYLFKGSDYVREKVYYLTNQGIIQEKVMYPIMNSINTFVCCTGFSIPLYKTRHLCEIFIRYMYGHAYGYIDSRETRSVFSAGIMITKL